VNADNAPYWLADKKYIKRNWTLCNCHTVFHPSIFTGAFLGHIIIFGLSLVAPARAYPRQSVDTNLIARRAQRDFPFALWSRNITFYFDIFGAVLSEFGGAQLVAPLCLHFPSMTPRFFNSRLPKSHLGPFLKGLNNSRLCETCPKFDPG